MIIGLCICVPIYLYSFTNSAQIVLNNPENNIGIITLIVFIVGGVLFLIGFYIFLRE